MKINQKSSCDFVYYLQGIYGLPFTMPRKAFQSEDVQLSVSQIFFFILNDIFRAYFEYIELH